MKWLGKLGLCYVVLASMAIAADIPKTLQDLEGKEIPGPMNGKGDFTVLCFLGSECPLARLYGPRLEKLSQDFPRVRFLGLSSNRQDSLEDIQAYVNEIGLTFEFAKDYDNVLANEFEATRTPEVVVLGPLGEIRYRGRIDDQYIPGVAKPEPTRHDLRVALEELTSGKSVSVAETQPAGCLIGKVPQSAQPTELTYCQEISRILQRHCVECHREGDIGPFALTDYEEVVGWGEMMLEVIDDGRMPPWHANPKYGEFHNSRQMPVADKEALREWVAGGMPHGNPQDLPEPLPVVERWRIPGGPDAVYAMSEDSFSVPADGVVEYQYFVVDPGFEEDVWVSSAEVRPGNRSVVHHCIVFIRPPDGAEFRGTGFLSGYVPGQRATTFPEGYARKIPAGASLVFQMHYTPNGAPAKDRTEIALKFLPESQVTHDVITVIGINRDFEIPPHAEKFPVSGQTRRLPQNGELLAITPHMHYRGESFTAFLDESDGRSILLDVPQYDFNWQHVYELKKPLSIRDIDRIRFTCRFNNSDSNPANPDPSIHVTWGDQTWEEMAVAFFEVARPHGQNDEIDEPVVLDPVADRKRSAEINQFVKSFFSRFDSNKDGTILPEEMPLAQKRFGFGKFDENHDQQLTESEVRRVAMREKR